MKIRVSLYLLYNETEINCKGFICPLSYANKVGDISYFGALYACNHFVCGTSAHQKICIAEFKFVDPSLHLLSCFFLLTEVYFQDIEHMQGY